MNSIQEGTEISTSSGTTISSANMPSMAAPEHPMGTFGRRLAINPIGVVGDGDVVADFEPSHLRADRDHLARTITNGDGRWIARDRVIAPGNH